MEKLGIINEFKNIVGSLKELKDTITTGFYDMLGIKKNEEKESVKKETKGQETELKEELRHKEWKTEGRFTISEGIFPNMANTRFGLNGTNSNAKLILNGPLFAPGGKPVGGYIEGGNVKKDFITNINDKNSGNFYKNNGIIGYGTDGQMHMFSHNDITEQTGSTVKLKDGKDITFKRAFQNGPMLVENGVVQTQSSGKKVDRTAIGFTESGEIRGIQAKQCTLGELANFAQNSGLKNVMYLDGSSGIAGMSNGETGQKRGNTSKGAVGLQLG